MEKFESITGIAIPLFVSNINTDTLMPSEWGRDHPNELGPGLLRHWRYGPDGKETPGFVFNDPRFREAMILVAGINFGCGSSRETAVWGLVGYGIRVVIAPSFGEIFCDNAFQNGLLVIDLPLETVESLCVYLAKSGDPTMTVDLVRRVVEYGGQSHAFVIADDRREALLEGLDDTALLQRYETDTTQFQAQDRKARPWVYLTKHTVAPYGSPLQGTL